MNWFDFGKDKKKNENVLKMKYKCKELDCSNRVEKKSTQCAACRQRDEAW